MLNYKRCISSLLILCCIAPWAIAKQNPKDWNNVRILDPGANIIVKTRAGESYEGEFKDATVDSLAVIIKVPGVMRQIITLRKDEVKEVRRKMSRAASTAIGAGIGLGVGIGLGAIADAKDKYGEDPGLGKAVFGFLGCSLGAIIGLRMSLYNKKIYEAP
ncbi:MAG: hypothetical protein V7641_2769 [Blastocatellia bacterium]